MDYKVKITKSKVLERRNFSDSLAKKMGHNVAVEVCAIVKSDTFNYRLRRYFLYDEVCLWEEGENGLKQTAKEDFMEALYYTTPPMSTNNKTTQEYLNELNSCFVFNEAGFVEGWSEKLLS